MPYIGLGLHVTREQSGPTLLHARTLAAIQAPGTREAFERAIMYANDAAARCLCAEWLQTQPDRADQERAAALFNDILNDARGCRVPSGKAPRLKSLRSGPPRRAPAP